jgi:hypothetical protein|tara:strand:+ start:220 stop:411 length:192 start_codon:yes stop_codon:yes gene_type:complete
MQYALPIDGFASEYNEDITRYFAIYLHYPGVDDPFQGFIIRELESDFERHEVHGVPYEPDWRI